MKVFIKAALFVMTIGLIAFGLNFIFGTQTQSVVTYLTKDTINEITLYKFDIFSYLKNLEATFKDTPKLLFELPSREWININSSIVEEQFWSDLVNNLAYMLDIIISVANILLFPLRIVFYAIQIILAIIGLPMIQGTYDYNPLKWLIDIVKTLATLQIPYV